MMFLAAVTFSPCFVLLVSALIIRPGLRTWAMLILSALALAISTVFLRQGVIQSCQIDQSECLGATATSYLVVALWGVFSIWLLVRVVVEHRKVG
jgi:predicted neutral ceramidase superfamily lipid hydrolase